MSASKNFDKLLRRGAAVRNPVRTVTIYDVAERAGVSISTVSLAINSPHRVTEPTRERVVAAAAALGYRARSGARGAEKSVRVSVAAPFSSYPSYFRRLTGMLLRARDTAVEVTTHDLESAASSVAPVLDALPARQGVDGLLVMGVPLGVAALRASRDAALPVVLVDVRRPRSSRDDVSTVLVDDELGGRMIGAHLATLGHTRVAFLHEPQRSPDYLSAGALRLRGLTEHLQVIEVPCPASTDPAVALHGVLRRRSAPTAVVANHDELAFRAWRGLTATGLRVPQDVALVGYDDGLLAESISLTTVRQPFEESGRVALELLISSITGRGTAVQRIDLSPSLVVRDST